MRRLALILALLLLLPAAAAAKSIEGTAKADKIRGTQTADAINVVGGGRDTVACLAGRDVVTADASDSVARDCEIVSRRIAFDQQVDAPAQHRTQLESDVASNGSTIVSVFQNGRFQDGGATGIGWATSTDGGAHWRSGLLPGLTRFSPSPGQSSRASDPAVTWDAAHGVWLVSSLIVAEEFSGLFISRSTDGLNWSGPVVASQELVGDLAYDKEWVACDSGASSRFAGSCYLVYTDFPRDQLTLQASHDGGLTWGSRVTVDDASGADVVGAIPVTQPDGALTVVFLVNEGALFAARSTDGGATFAPRVGIAPVSAHPIRGLRAPPLPSATVDASGRIFVVWADCSFRSLCAGNDIVLTSSTDGATWAPLTRLPGVGFESFVPDIAADATTPGRLAIVTYVVIQGSCTIGLCTMGVATTRSNDGGRTWRAPQRLDAQPMRFAWLPDAGGRFLGDYVGIAFTRLGIVPAFPLATRPVGGLLSESMFATVLR